MGTSTELRHPVLLILHKVEKWAEEADGGVINTTERSHDVCLSVQLRPHYNVQELHAAHRVRQNVHFRLFIGIILFNDLLMENDGIISNYIYRRHLADLAIALAVTAVIHREEVVALLTK